MKVLIIVDMQKDFIDGSLGTKEAVAIVENVVNRVADSEGELILFTQDTHDSGYLSTPEGKKLPVMHCLEGTEGWKINAKILSAWRNNPNTVKASGLQENSFAKPVFASLKLVDYLKARASKIDEIEILGLCTDICVISNAIIIKNTLPHIEISVNEKCCAGVTPQSHKEAINTMKMCQINII
ncbi:MAG: cysteine hydrolase [Defluviitaleaceae bacterium]|nr:cysteine hydrolase [Defluviitaleaceae bacterium]